MIFVGGRPEVLFRSRKKATKRVFECGLNSDFNIILYADYTGIVGDTCDKVCFVVPVHYPSFIFTFDQKISLEKSVDKFFEFEQIETRKLLYEYVSSIKNRSAEKIAFFR